MTNTQSSQTKPMPPKISIFDKKGQSNLSKFSKGPNIQLNQNKVNLPQFRINQHKGA